MKYWILLNLLYLSLINIAWTQPATGCYQSFLQQGKADYDQYLFPEAIENFRSAIICNDRPDDLSTVTEWLKNAQDGYFKEIKKQQALVEAALREAEQERNAADSARIVAEANRLALMARLAGDEALTGSDTNALVLSYSAYQMIKGKTVSAPIKNAFGEASLTFFSKDHTVETGPVFSMLAIPEQPAIVLESGKGNLGILNLQTMAYSPIGQHQDYLSQMLYDSSHQMLLTTAVDGSIKTWNLLTRQPTEYPSHQGAVTGAVFATQSPGFLTVSADRSGKLWNFNGHLSEQLPKQQGVPFGIHVAANGNFLTRSTKGEVIVWDPNGRKLVQLPSSQAYLYDAQLSPDGRLIVTASTDKTARIRDLAGKEIASLPHDFAVKSATFSPGGDRILTQTLGNSAKLWDASGKLIKELNDHKGQLTLATFSPKGTYILTGAKDNTVKIWDINGNISHSLTLDGNPIAAYFSPNEELILTTSQDGFSKLWDLNGDLLRTIPLYATNTVASIFSANGHYIISVPTDQSIDACPVPAYAGEIIETKKPISLSRVEAAERQYGIQIQQLWSKK